MALKVEGIVDGGMHAEEVLGGSGRFEPTFPGLPVVVRRKDRPFGGLGQR
jgi:hypothetical protein